MCGGGGTETKSQALNPAPALENPSHRYARRIEIEVSKKKLNELTIDQAVAHVREKEHQVNFFKVMPTSKRGARP